MASPGRTARLDGFVLDIDGDMMLRDTIDKAIHKHEFAFRDGAMLEDLGAGAREVRFKCYFLEDRFDEHYKFLDHALKTEDALYELDHPAYGSLKGKISSVSIIADPVNFYAEIDVVFVEELQGKFSVVAPSTVNVVGNLVDAGYQEGQTQHLMSCASDCLAAMGSDGRAIVGATLDPAQSIVGSFTGISLEMRDILNAMDEAVDKMDSLLSSVTIPVDEGASLFEYPSTVPGRIVSASANVSERYAASLENLADSPEAYISNLASAMSCLADLFENEISIIRKQILIASGLVLARKTGYRYSEDEERRSVVRQIEETEAFDWAGNYLFPPEAPVIMNIDQLEQTLATVRVRIQLAVDEDRTITALKAMAKAILDHIYRIKLETEKIIAKSYTSELPLHAICLREGLSYNCADRVLTLNKGVRNPSFMVGEVKVYAR